MQMCHFPLLGCRLGIEAEGIAEFGEEAWPHEHFRSRAFWGHAKEVIASEVGTRTWSRSNLCILLCFEAGGRN